MGNMLSTGVIEAYCPDGWYHSMVLKPPEKEPTLDVNGLFHIEGREDMSVSTCFTNMKDSFDITDEDFLEILGSIRIINPHA